jgi:hypothetical protein
MAQILDRKRVEELRAKYPKQAQRLDSQPKQVQASQQADDLIQDEFSGMSRTELYEQAQERDISGRSKMDEEELRAALRAEGEAVTTAQEQAEQEG